MPQSILSVLVMIAVALLCGFDIQDWRTALIVFSGIGCTRSVGVHPTVRARGRLVREGVIYRAVYHLH